MILADTSVWIDHFRQGLPELGESLRRGEIVMHSFVVGELACAKFSTARHTLELLQQLRSVEVAEHKEVMNCIRMLTLQGSWHRLFGRLLARCSSNRRLPAADHR